MGSAETSAQTMPAPVTGHPELFRRRGSPHGAQPAKLLYAKTRELRSNRKAQNWAAEIEKELTARKLRNLRLWNSDQEP
jgi:hypothetical protein